MITGKLIALCVSIMPSLAAATAVAQNPGDRLVRIAELESRIDPRIGSGRWTDLPVKAGVEANLVNDAT